MSAATVARDSGVFLTVAKQPKSRLPIRVSRVHSSSGENVLRDSNPENQPKHKPSRIPIKDSRQTSGTSHNDLSDENSKRTARTLQTNDSGISLSQHWQQNERISAKKNKATSIGLSNPSRPPLKSSAENSPRSLPRNKQKTGGIIIPRETRTSELRKQKLSNKKKAPFVKEKVKPAAKTTNTATVEHDAIKQDCSTEQDLNKSANKCDKDCSSQWISSSKKELQSVSALPEKTIRKSERSPADVDLVESDHIRKLLEPHVTIVKNCCNSSEAEWSPESPTFDFDINPPSIGDSGCSTDDEQSTVDDASDGGKSPALSCMEEVNPRESIDQQADLTHTECALRAEADSPQKKDSEVIAREAKQHESQGHFVEYLEKPIDEQSSKRQSSDKQVELNTTLLRRDSGIVEHLSEEKSSESDINDPTVTPLQCKSLQNVLGEHKRNFKPMNNSNARQETIVKSLVTSTSHNNGSIPRSANGSNAIIEAAGCLSYEQQSKDIEAGVTCKVAGKPPNQLINDIISNEVLENQQLAKLNGRQHMEEETEIQTVDGEVDSSRPKGNECGPYKSDIINGANHKSFNNAHSVVNGIKEEATANGELNERSTDIKSSTKLSQQKKSQDHSTNPTGEDARTVQDKNEAFGLRNVFMELTKVDPSEIHLGEPTISEAFVEGTKQIQDNSIVEACDQGDKGYEKKLSEVKAVTHPTKMKKCSEKGPSLKQKNIAVHDPGDLDRKSNQRMDANQLSEYEDMVTNSKEKDFLSEGDTTLSLKMMKMKNLQIYNAELFEDNEHLRAMNIEQRAKMDSLLKKLELAYSVQEQQEFAISNLKDTVAKLEHNKEKEINELRKWLKGVTEENDTLRESLKDAYESTIGADDTEAQKIADELQELKKLHRRIGDIRMAFSGKEETQLEKSLIKTYAYSSRITLLQNIQKVVLSIVLMSEEFQDGAKTYFAESGTLTEAGQKDKTHEDGTHSEPLGKEDYEIELLEEETKALENNIENNDEQRRALEFLMDSVGTENEELHEQIDSAETNSLENKLEEVKMKIDRNIKHVLKARASDKENMVTEAVLERQTDERNEQKKSLECMKASVNRHNDKLFQQIDALEKELKNCQNEKNNLQVQLAMKVESREIIPKENGENNFKASDGIKTLREEKKNLQIELELIEQQKHLMENLTASVETENDQLFNKVSALEGELKNCQAEKHNLEIELLNVKHQLNRLRSEEKHRKREILELKETMQSKLLQCEELGKALDSLETENETVEQIIRSMEETLSQCQKSKRRLEMHVSQMESEIGTLKMPHVTRPSVDDGVRIDKKEVTQRDQRPNKLKGKMKKPFRFHMHPAVFGKANDYAPRKKRDYSLKYTSGLEEEVKSVLEKILKVKTKNVERSGQDHARNQIANMLDRRLLRNEDNIKALEKSFKRELRVQKQRDEELKKLFLKQMGSKPALANLACDQNAKRDDNQERNARDMEEVLIKSRWCPEQETSELKQTEKEDNLTEPLQVVEKLLEEKEKFLKDNGVCLKSFTESDGIRKNELPQPRSEEGQENKETDLETTEPDLEEQTNHLEHNEQGENQLRLLLDNDNAIETLQRRLRRATRELKATKAKLGQREAELEDADKVLLTFRHCLVEMQEELEKTRKELKSNDLALKYVENCAQMMFNPAVNEDFDMRIINELFIRVVREMKRLQERLDGWQVAEPFESSKNHLEEMEKVLQMKEQRISELESYITELQNELEATINSLKKPNMVELQEASQRVIENDKKNEVDNVANAVVDLEQVFNKVKNCLQEESDKSQAAESWVQGKPEKEPFNENEKEKSDLQNQTVQLKPALEEKGLELQQSNNCGQGKGGESEKAVSGELVQIEMRPAEELRSHPKEMKPMKEGQNSTSLQESMKQSESSILQKNCHLQRTKECRLPEKEEGRVKSEKKSKRKRHRKRCLDQKSKPQRK